MKLRMDDATGTRVGSPLCYESARGAADEGKPLWMETRSRMYSRPTPDKWIPWLFEYGRNNYGLTWRMWNHPADETERTINAWRRKGC